MQRDTTILTFLAFNHQIVDIMQQNPALLDAQFLNIITAKDYKTCEIILNKFFFRYAFNQHALASPTSSNRNVSRTINKDVNLKSQYYLAR